MTETLIRPARVADEADILQWVDREMKVQGALDERLRPRPDAHARFAVSLRRRMQSFDSAVFVAVEGEKPIGVIVVCILEHDGLLVERRFGMITDVLVAPESRRRGVGRLLWKRASRWLRDHAVTTARLQVASSNEGGRAFWQRVGGDEVLCEVWLAVEAEEQEGEEE